MAPTLRHPSFDPAGQSLTPGPLTDAAAAMAVVRLAASDPPRPETVVLFLDDVHVGRGCCIVSGTTAPDDVLDVGALAAEVAARSPDIHAIVLATVRAGPAADAGAGLEPQEDVGRWLVLLDLFDELGVELLDWFVLGSAPEVRSLRAHTGMLSPWRGS